MDLQSSSSSTLMNEYLYEMIKENYVDDIECFLCDGKDVNAPLWTTGEFAGYTAMHVACMENKSEVVYLLITEFNADVNLVAEDGTLPIHLACFYEPYRFPNDFYTETATLSFLLEHDANADAEFGREIFTKHVKDEEWCPDFGEKITPLIYTVIYKKPSLACDLMREQRSHLEIKSLKNKTLLMYALEYNLYDVSSYLIDVIEDPAHINLQDDDGIPTIQHVLHPKKYNQFRYDSRELMVKTRKRNDNMFQLIDAGANKYALINGDPDTFLPNVAAYRSCSDFLEFLLSCYDSMPVSKVLYNATLPIDDNVEKMVRLYPNDTPDDFPLFMRRIQEERQKKIEVAVKDLVIRRAIGLHTNEEEMKLMEKLIATDEDIKKIVNNLEGNFINGELKTRFIDVNNKKISVLDFLKQVFDRKKLKLWASDKTTYQWDCIFFTQNPLHNNYFWLYKFVSNRVENGCIRLKILKRLEKVSILRKFINLPYEIILEFIEYLNNNELDAFIDAFIS